MQEQLQALFAADRGAVAGYKIAITTPVMQRLMGIDHPCGCAIFARMTHASPARLRRADYVNVAVEGEIAVRLGSDLPGNLPGGRRYDRDSVADAVAACMAAIEIIDDQNAAYKKADALKLIANNACNGGVGLGPRPKRARSAVSESMKMIKPKTGSQLPAVWWMSAATGPPSTEPMPCAM